MITFSERLRAALLMGAFGAGLALSACGKSDGLAGPPTIYHYYAYAANSGSQNVSAYLLNAANGTLADIDVYPAGSQPSALSATPDGKYLYVANAGSGTISGFAIDRRTGALSATGTASAQGSGPSALAIHPSGRFLYGANKNSGTVAAFRLDPASGALSAVGTVAADIQPVSLALNPLGTFLYCVNVGSNDVSVYSINGDTGALTAVQTFATGSVWPSSLAIDPDGERAFLVNNADPAALQVLAINAADGKLSSAQSVSLASGLMPISIAVDPLSRFVLMTSSNVSTSTYRVNLFAIDSATQALSATPIFLNPGVDPSGLAIDPTGKFALVANAGSSNNLAVFRISSTGTLSLVTYKAADTAPRAVLITRVPQAR